MILVPLLLAASGAFAKGGNIVGNGGDGFFDGKRVYVRDLWEASAYRPTPWIGEKADPGIPMATIETSMKAIGVSNDLLRRKLTDVNAFRPGLGDALVKVIESYVWVLTGETIELPAPETSYAELLTPPPGPRVQLAVRNDGIIKIRSDWWALMAPEDRLGLVLHEAMTSLLPLSCSMHYCSQDQTYYRVSVGTLFAEYVMKAMRSSVDAREFVLGSFKNAFTISLDQFEVRLTIADREIAVSSYDQRVDLETVCAMPREQRNIASLIVPEIFLRNGYYFDLGLETLDYRTFSGRGRLSLETRELTADSKEDCLTEIRGWLRDARRDRLDRMTVSQEDSN